MKEYINILNKTTLDMNQIKNKKSFLYDKPELFELWDFEKNNEIGLDIYEVKKSYTVNPFWYCHKCNDSYQQKLVSKVRNNGECLICLGKIVTESNCLASIRPYLIEHWDYTKNGELNPWNVTYGKGLKVWWECPVCTDEKFVNIRSKRQCVVCIGKQVLKGFNDMWTTNPKLASMLANPEDGYKYMQNSNTKVNWKCSDCDNIVKQIFIPSVNKQGLSCPRCGDGISFGEKYMFGLLEFLEVDFERQKKFDWSDGKIYDFYIPSLDSIIEVHGEQHSVKSFENRGGKTLEEEKINDIYKKKMASENRITNYIIVDSRILSIDYITKMTIESGLLEVLNVEINKFKEYKFDKLSKFTVRSWELWNTGDYTVKEIADKLKMHEGTIKRYLKNGNSLNKCVFPSKNKI